MIDFLGFCLFDLSQKKKVEHQKPDGLLQPLDVLE